jgi:hypothetical protein
VSIKLRLTIIKSVIIAVFGEKNDLAHENTVNCALVCSDPIEMHVLNDYAHQVKIEIHQIQIGANLCTDTSRENIILHIEKRRGYANITFFYFCSQSMQIGLNNGLAANSHDI